MLLSVDWGALEEVLALGRSRVEVVNGTGLEKCSIGGPINLRSIVQLIIEVVLLICLVYDLL